MKINLSDITKEYYEAVENFIETVKKDVNVIAVLVQGSMTNDVVWEKSDIDAMVVVRDQDIKVGEFCLDADDIVLNMSVVTRSNFVRMLERGKGGGLGHSVMAKSKVMYTIDDSITEMLTKNQQIGIIDAERAAINIACDAVGLIEKCEKWLYVKEDFQYCRYYIIKTGEILANLEICMALEPARREAIQRAAVLNPPLVERFYTYPMNNILQRDELERLIREMDDYLVKNMDFFSRPILRFLSDGEMKTATMFMREFGAGGHFLTHLLDYMVSKGVIDKVSQTIRLTPKSRPMLEEIAYMSVTDSIIM